jgi:uncharacterized protein YoxC
MPPIRQLDDAFLSQLLDPADGTYETILKTNISSDSLSCILTKLTVTSNALQQDLFRQVQDNFELFSSLYNESQDLHAYVFDLVQSVSETTTKVTHTDQKVHATIDVYQQALRESQFNQSKIETLEHLEAILQIIASIETELKQCSYLDAVKHVKKLVEILAQPRDEATRTVVGFIQSKVDSLKQSLISQLQESIRTAIQYNPGSMRILQTFQMNDNTVHISQVLQCLYELGILPEELMSVQRFVFKNILNVYFEDVCSVLQIDHVEVDRVGSGGVLQVIRHEGAEKDPVIMLQHMDAILGFFDQYMFDQKDIQIRRLFGNLLFTDLFNTMISKSIGPAIPSSQEQLPGFDRIVQAVTQFETQCERYGYVTNGDTNLLSAYVGNMDQHYAKKRRERILQQGRKVMIRRLYDTDMAQVQGADGHTYKYQITQTPQILLVLISDTLAEAEDLLDSHPISASSLVNGIQDLLDMYRAIMPSYHRPQYLDNAANALVFRNDCVWLSHQLIADIAAKVRHFDHLQQDLRDAAERLAELGKAWHELAMMQRVQMIQSTLDTLDGFSGMADGKFQQDCDRAVTRVIQYVLTFASELRPVVDETLFLDMLGRIVDSILARLIHDIEELIDIGAQESHIIAVTLNSLAQLVGAFDLPGQDATEPFVVDLVPSWQKFWLVKDILEMNMRDIMESFRRGDLHMFEKSELIGLLCALFADTELRESNIQEIKADQSPSDSASKSPVVTMSASREVSKMSSPKETVSKEAVPTGLTYTPDEDLEEASGWDDEEEDLFTSNTPIQNTTSLSLALSPDHDIEQGTGWNDDNDDDLFSEEIKSSSCLDDNGWGDANQDIFNNAVQHAETSSAYPAKTEGTTESPKKSALSAPALEDDNEQDWGWDDDDDDLFKEQDMK